MKTIRYFFGELLVNLLIGLAIVIVSSVMIETLYLVYTSLNMPRPVADWVEGILVAAFIIGVIISVVDTLNAKRRGKI